MLSGNNGILSQANSAKEQTAIAEAEERNGLNEQNKLIENLTKENLAEPGKIVEITKKDNYQDVNGDKATIPAGFTVSGIESEQKIADGLVIYDIPKGVEIDWTKENEDGTYEVQRLYNQFVWIPVRTEEEYKRNLTYPSDYDTTMEEVTFAMDDRFSTTNMYLPDIIKPEVNNSINNDNAEKENVIKYNGFYIARYETGNENEVLVSKQNAVVMNNKTIGNIVDLSKKMYNDDSVKSALCSGIQWDVMMDFVDGKLDGGRENYFNVEEYQASRHNETGITNCGKNINDKVQNIYDLEGNCYEFTAECNNIEGEDRIKINFRGGYYKYYKNDCASKRAPGMGMPSSGYTFRCLLYIM